MLKTDRMTKLSVTGTKNVIEKVIKELYSLKAIDIVEHKKSESVDIGSPLEKADSISSLLVRIRGLISTLEIKNISLDEKKYFNYSENNKLKTTLQKINSISELHDQVLKIQDEIKIFEDKNKLLKENIKVLELLKNLKIGLENFIETKNLSYVIGVVKKKEMLKKILDKVTTRYEISFSESNKKEVVAIFFEYAYRGKILEVLSNNGFSEISISNLIIKEGLPAETFNKIENDLKSNENKISSLSRKLGKIGKDWGNFLVVEESLLSKELDRLEAPLKFASSSNVFVVEGFVPSKWLSKVKDRLNKVSGGKIYIETHEFDKKDIIPVKLDNPKNVKPFEFLMHLYTLPNYKEIDPTFFVFLTFPFFFGFMLGDIGYGVVTLGLFMWLKNKVPALKQLFELLIFASLSTIFFGFLFGEIFGAEIVFGYDLPRIMSRLHEITSLLYLAVALGFVHLNMGLIIGFINEKKSHGMAHAVYAKLSWMVLQAGAILLGLSYGGIISLTPIIGYVLIVLAAVMLFKGEGIAGVLELPAIFSNMLSYARLMAIGVASASLAVVVNTFAFDAFRGGIGGIITGILILVLGHTINIALGILGPFLHSLRLHYVEFFSKFYKGGGKNYTPFGANT